MRPEMLKNTETRETVLSSRVLAADGRKTPTGVSSQLPLKHQFGDYIKTTKELF